MEKGRSESLTPTPRHAIIAFDCQRRDPKSTMSFPNPDSCSKQPSPGRGIRLAYGSEPPQFGELYLPGDAGPHPTVILIHGGYWRARYKLDLMTGLAEDLARRGIAAWNIEYQRVGDRGGGWPATFLDVARAADYLRVLAPTYLLDLKRVVPVGHSAGGHLALWLAARHHIKDDILRNAMTASESGTIEITHTPLELAGAISLAGVVDLEMAYRLNLSNGAVVGLLGGSPRAVPERYTVASPAALLPLGIPQVVIHGTEDESVPLEVSQGYVAGARAANDQVTFRELVGVDHFDLIDPHSTAWAITVEALGKLLGIK